MTVEDFWAAVRALGLRNPTRGSPDLDYICTTKEGQATHVADPEKLEPDDRAEVVLLLRQRHGDLH